MTTETFDGEYTDDTELQGIEDQVNAAKDLPIAERVSTINRLMANFLNRRGKLPDDLKKNLDN